MIHKGELANRFTYHQPTEVKAALHEAMRHWTKDLAGVFNNELPDSREKSLAITHLEQALMWANAAIARNDLQPKDELTHD